MSIQVYSRAAELASQGRCFAVATVVRVAGSASAKPGTKALIDDQGKIVTGWVGGGCAESAVRDEALKCIEREKPTLITLDMTDELLGVGMPCGGIMDVYIEPVIPMPELLIVGHGRIAEVVATLGHLMEFRVVVNNLASGSGQFPQADRLIDQDLDLNDTPIGPRTYVVIATMHKSDHLWLQKALESEAAYVALIASRHRAALVLDYLRATGMPSEKVEKVWAPAGLDLGALTPEEIGLSIMSQIVAVRRGGSAVSLCRKTEAEGAPAAPENRVIRQCGPAEHE